MKKAIVLILGILVYSGIQAQLKTFNPGDAKKDSELEIIPPASKLSIFGPNRPSGTFQPKTLDLVLNTENGLSVEKRSKDKQLPILIKGKPSKTIKTGTTPEARSFNYLENAKGLMKIQNPSEEFRILKTQKSDLGFTHVRMQQEVNGIPVYGAEVIFHFNDEESFLNGRYEATPVLDSYEPSIDKSAVLEIAIEDIGGLTEISNDKFGIFDFERLKSELVIYDGRLAYHMSIYKNIIDLWEYFVDANTGEIIHKHTNMCKFHNHDSSDSPCVHNEKVENDIPAPVPPVVSNATDLFGTSRLINTYEINGKYYMIDADRDMFDGVNSSLPDNPIGTIWTIDAFDTSPENSNFTYDHVSSLNINFSGENTGVSAQYNGGQAYLYFKNVHDRESINGASGNVISLINIADDDGSTLGNAFWNGVAMFYGNGDNSFKPLARGLDVAGHEMSHGVIQSTANLVYQGESGALNESFADVFGAMIDREDWLIGEDVVEDGAFPSGALRSLEDPHNGASPGDFNRGWQPKKYSERFTGPQDNGGVHINSGIPNHAFYLFASDPAVGKIRAEKVYYEVLVNYLTMSSQFIDARLAVVEVATQMYGTNVGNIAKAAFDEVEIFDGNGTNTQNDVDINPGDDLILFTLEDTDIFGNTTQNNLYVADKDGNLIFNPLTSQDPLSVPSISDDGSEIVFVNQDKKLNYIRIDWETRTVIEDIVLGFSETYRNVVFSRDGLRMAVLRDNADDEIFVFDWVTLTGVNYQLFNPTTIDTIQTADVLGAEAMQFDFSGEYLMYDAANRIQGASGDIYYWDIGFIKVFNNDTGTFTLGTEIQKLFQQLPEGYGVGNPTFSKNSDYIVAFEFFNNTKSDILGINIETGELKNIYLNNDRLGYPSYSNNDVQLIFDASGDGGRSAIRQAQLESNKIESSSSSIFLADQDFGLKWGVWFSNGDRVLADEDVILKESSFELFPNPTSQILNIKSQFSKEQLTAVRIVDMMGRVVYHNSLHLENETSIDISTLNSGQYVLSIINEEGRGNKIFVKQ